MVMLAQLVQRLELLTHVAKVQGSIPLDVSILNSVKTREMRCNDRFVVNALLTHIVFAAKNVRFVLGGLSPMTAPR